MQLALPRSGVVEKEKLMLTKIFKYLGLRNEFI